MKAGFAEVEYTPNEGFMPGEFQAFFAKGAYTPLQANAAAFEQNGETVILISADHLLFHTAYASSIREGVAEKTGVPVKNVLLAATHTHMGPSYDKPCWKSPAEPEIAQVVAHRIVQAAVQAFENMSEGVTLATATAEEKRFSFVRDVVLKDGRIVKTAGTCDRPVFTAEVSVDGGGSACAEGGSRREAESAAAAKLIEEFGSR